MVKGDEGFTIVENKKSSLKKKISDKIKYKSNKINILDKNTSNLLSEEYSENVSNYENKLEQRQMDSGKSGTKSRKSSKGPKSSFMNYDDKQIVVIDNNDIKESTKGVDDVIIVDKKKDVDLAELLGKNWPSNGGEPCEILNSDSGCSNLTNFIKSAISSSTAKNERNKSPSFISHINPKKHNNKNDESTNYMISELTKLDSATGGARTRDVKENNSKYLVFVFV